jgi:hypothetical protein
MILTAVIAESPCGEAIHALTHHRRDTPRPGGHDGDLVCSSRSRRPQTVLRKLSGGA